MYEDGDDMRGCWIENERTSDGREDVVGKNCNRKEDVVGKDVARIQKTRRARLLGG
jgi:hypothetical protein